MRGVLIVLLMTVSFNAFSDGLYLGGWSQHFNTKGDGSITLNESHNIVAVEYNNWLVGYFKNSYNDDSGVVARKYRIMSGNNLSFDVAIGTVYGYRTCERRSTYPNGSSKKWCPAVVPEISYTKYRVQPSVMVMSSAVVVAIKVGF